MKVRCHTSVDISKFDPLSEGRTPLSREGEEAISRYHVFVSVDTLLSLTDEPIFRVRYALHQPFAFDDIVKDVLLCYGNWVFISRKSLTTPALIMTFLVEGWSLFISLIFSLIFLGSLNLIACRF